MNLFYIFDIEEKSLYLKEVNNTVIAAVKEFFVTGVLFSLILITPLQTKM